MSQKPALRKRPAPKKESSVNRETLGSSGDEPVELTGMDILLDRIQPHIVTIGLVILAVFLGIVSFAFYRQATFTNEAITWRDLNQASATNMQTGDVKNLTRVADTYPESKAGLYGAMLAADSQLRNGLQELNSDREAGFGLIRKAKQNFQMVLDAPDRLKTTLLSQRSQFGLAYASESLGEFDDAKKLYKELLEAAPDSPMAEQAQRGVERCSDPQFATLYQEFKNYVDPGKDDAPGPVVPDRPSIGDFPEIDLEPGQTPPAGDTPGSEMKPGDGAPAASEPASGTDPSKTEQPAQESTETKKPDPPAEPVAKPATDPPAESGGGTETPPAGGNGG